jgi:CheY-like chemotaxis protein
LLRAPLMRGKAPLMSDLPARARRPVRVSPAPVSEGSATLHVLIADGNEHSRAVRQQQLRAAGFRVSVARTGFEAIVKASCHVPDLILLDGSLGDGEASETGRLLTTCPVTAHIPVVAVSPGRRVPQRVLSDIRRRIAV